jgi:hypothetical protein
MPDEPPFEGHSHGLFDECTSECPLLDISAATSEEV